MKIHQVASKEIWDVGSSRVPWIFTGGYICLLTYIAHTIPEPSGTSTVYRRQYLIFVEHGGATTVDMFITELMPLVVFLVPIAGLVVGYGAVVPERETNSIRTLLALPYSRLDVIAGKLVGRIILFSLPLFIGFVIASGVTGLGFEKGTLFPYLLFAVYTADIGTAFVCMGVGLSASLRSSFRVLAANLTVYFLFVYFWQIGSLATGLPLEVLNPIYAYTAIVASISNDLGTVYTVTMANTGSTVDANPGLFFSEWFGIFILLIWHAAPVAVGYHRFKTADLT